MNASAGQRKLLELLLEFRELDPEVVAAVELLLKEDEILPEQVQDLVAVLNRAPEAEGKGLSVRGIIRS